MATWTVRPSYKKSIIEYNFYIKDNNRFMHETGWRGGEFSVETEDDNPPDIEEGVNIYDCGYDAELLETFDGCWEDYDYDGCDEETTKWLQEFFEEGNSAYDLEEHGWMLDECEMTINCPLIIEDENGNVVVDQSKEEE